MTSSDDSAGGGELLGREALLKRLGGDPDLIAGLIALYLEHWPEWFEEVRRAVQARDAGRLNSSAHFLKGAVANFSNGPAYEGPLRLEIMGKSADFTHADSALAELETALHQFARSLTQLLQEPS